MRYITSVERLGREAGRQEGLEDGLRKGRDEGLREGRDEGLREGLLDGIALALKLRFGSVGQELVPEIRQLSDLALIRAVYARIEVATSIEEIRQVYR